MKWIELKIETTEEAYDAICEMLTTVGAGGVSIEDPNDIRREAANARSLDYFYPKFLEALGDSVIVKSYFPGNINLAELEGLVTEKLDFISRFLDVGKGYIGHSEIDEEDWSTAWKKYYKPFNISDRVVIKPTWEQYASQKDEIIVEMDPGMAFGTGTHETTSMCAKLLEKYLRSGDNVLDIGCGTGILSIISIKLGAWHATALDVDGVAVKVANENAVINHVSDRMDAFKGELKDAASQKADLVVANIIANVLIDISTLVPAYIRQGGYYITSGIIRERMEDVIQAYEKCGFTHEETMQMGEWAAIVFKCQNSL